MSAFVNHEFTRAFLLDEERLRKINSILVNRFTQKSENLKPKFKIYRNDAFTFETESIDEVLQEENPEWARIESISIYASDTDNFNLSLQFGKDGTHLKIEGENRDEVYLIFSELKNYLNAEVNTCKNVNERGLFKFAMFAIVIMFAGFVFQILRTNSDSLMVQKVLDNNDIVAKLNYLVQSADTRDKRVNLPMYLLIGISIIFLLIISDTLQKVLSYIHSQNEFLIGKRKIIIDKRKELVGKIIWIIGMGLIVSVVAGIMVWYFTRGAI